MENLDKFIVNLMVDFLPNKEDEDWKRFGPRPSARIAAWKMKEKGYSLVSEKVVEELLNNQNDLSVKNFLSEHEDKTLFGYKEVNEGPNPQRPTIGMRFDVGNKIWVETGSGLNDDWLPAYEDNPLNPSIICLK